MNFIKKIGVTHFVYICLFAATLIFAVAMLVWGASDPVSAETKVEEAEVLLADGVRREYLVGEKIAAEGIALKVGKKEVTDVKITGDTSSAGMKKVNVTYEKENVSYQGYFAVTVFSVRHYDLHSEPEEFYLDEEENWQVRGLEIWAELNAAPTEFVTVGTFDSVIALPSELYDVSVSQNEENKNSYSVAISFGSTRLDYYCVNDGGKMMTMNSPDRVLSFTNTNGTSETLTLYVKQIEAQGGDGENGAYGYYVFTDASGAQTVLQFKYYLDGNTASHFVSASFGEGLSDSYNASNEGYNAEYQGISFFAEKLAWHKAILNWDF